MSLQVWLPLSDGSLKQQGLNEEPAAGTDFTIENNGKLGKCIKTMGSGNSNGIDLGYDGNLINTNSISFGAWFKFNKAEIWSTISSYSYTSTRATPTGNLIGNNSYGGVSLQWSTNNIYNDGNLTDLVVTGYLRTSTNGARSTGYLALPFDTWVHLFFTFNKNTKIMTVWLNGEGKYAYTNLDFSDAKSQNLAINYPGIAGGNGPGFGIPFLVNDVRIYDHCLSTLEVRKLAQGLVLHYPLSDKFLEGTTNLITTEDCLSATCYNGATSKYNYGTSTDMYKTVTTYDGRKGTKVYMGTDGNAAFPYVYINNMYTSDGTNSPAYKTLSFDYYTNIGTSIRPYKLGSGSGTATYRITNKNGVATGTGTDSVSIPVVTNGWNHIEITFHGTTSADSQWGYIQNYPQHTSNTNNFWFFANMQLETKDHATGYAGVGGTRNSTTIYDTSGFINNGTISGNLTISNDTPKYQVSTYMPKAALITHPRPVFGGTDQEWTCAMWVKLDNVTQGQQAMNNFNISNNIVHSPTPLLYLNNDTNDYYMYGSQAVSAGVWTHVAFVFKNSNGTRNVYINGVLKNNYGPNRTSTPKGIPDIVTVGTNLAGYISDYRVYATALSADDVLDLYNNTYTVN